VDSIVQKNAKLIVLGIAAVFYLGDCIFFLSAPKSVIKVLIETLWLFGPPSSLIYGQEVAVPFTIGTILTSAAATASIYSKKIAWCFTFLFIAIACWILFGCIVYLPAF
jgi:hypothetical protein